MRCIFIVISIFLLSVFGSGCHGLNQNKVCLKNHCLYVELAQTDTEKRKGLMFREYLDSDRGMLFIYNEEGEYSFWMKNMLMSLDIVWINKDKEVVLISEDIQPCTADFCTAIKPNVKVKYVLEINARKAKGMGLNIGDKLEINVD